MAHGIIINLVTEEPTEEIFSDNEFYITEEDAVDYFSESVDYANDITETRDGVKNAVEFAFGSYEDSKSKPYQVTMENETFFMNGLKGSFKYHINAHKDMLEALYEWSIESGNTIDDLSVPRIYDVVELHNIKIILDGYPVPVMELPFTKLLNTYVVQVFDYHY